MSTSHQIQKEYLVRLDSIYKILETPLPILYYSDNPYGRSFNTSIKASLLGRGYCTSAHRIINRLETAHPQTRPWCIAMHQLVKEVRWAQTTNVRRANLLNLLFSVTTNST